MMTDRNQTSTKWTQSDHKLVTKGENNYKYKTTTKKCKIATRKHKPTAKGHKITTKTHRKIGKRHKMTSDDDVVNVSFNLWVLL